MTKKARLKETLWHFKKSQHYFTGKKAGKETVTLQTVLEELSKERLGDGNQFRGSYPKKATRVVTPGRLAGLCSRSILEIDCQNM